MTFSLLHQCLMAQMTPHQVGVFILVLHVTMVTEGFLYGTKGTLLPVDPAACTTGNVSFSCTVNDPSYTSADIRFKLRGDDLISDSKTEILDGSTKTVTLTDLTIKDHYTNVICCVNNCTQPRHTINVQILQVYDYPISVANFSCTRFGWDNWMICSWKLGQTYRRPPIITVHWRIPSFTSSWTPCPKVTGVTRCEWHNQGSIGNRDIQVKVNVTSQCGVWVSDIFNVNTTNVVKPYPLTKLLVTPVTSTCLKVEWNYTLSQEHGKQYKINLSSKWNDTNEPINIIQIKNQTKYEQFFCHLVPNTVYMVAVTVKPLTSGSESNKTSASASTFKDVPFASPEVTEGGYMWDPLQCDIRGRRTVSIYYKAIPERYENGEMKEVAGTSQTPFYYNSVLRNKIGVPAHYTHLNVELECYNKYSFEINVINEIGPSTKVSKFNIPEVTQDLKIPEVIIEASGSLVRLTWSKNLEAEPRGYTVFWCKRELGNCKNDALVHWQKVPDDVNSLMLNISSPEEYLYSVSMETQDSSTGMSWESCIYTMHAKPQQHPDSPKVSSIKDNSLSVYWNKIECVSGSPYIKFYKVVYCVWDKSTNSCGDDPRDIVLPATQTTATIEDLKEDIKYGVMVKGITADSQEGPLSEPTFGTPVRRSLKPAAIGGIATAGLVAFLLIIVGFGAIIRYCNKQRKKQFRLPEVTDILKDYTELNNSSSNGFVNKNYTVSVGGSDRLTEKLCSNTDDSLPSSPDRPKRQRQRQISADSGIPDDLMTPKATGDAITFPSPIDEVASNNSFEALITPDVVRATPSWPVPPGYSCINTEEDSIPRIRSYPSILNDYERDKGIELVKQNNPNAAGFVVDVQHELAVLTEKMQADLRKTKSQTEVDKLKSMIRHTGKTEDSVMKCKSTTEAMVVENDVSNKVLDTDSTHAYLPHSTKLANTIMNFSGSYNCNNTSTDNNPTMIEVDDDGQTYLPYDCLIGNDLPNLVLHKIDSTSVSVEKARTSKGTGSFQHTNMNASSYLPHTAADCIKGHIAYEMSKPSNAESYLPHFHALSKGLSKKPHLTDSMVCNHISHEKARMAIPAEYLPNTGALAYQPSSVMTSSPKDNHLMETTHMAGGGYVSHEAAVIATSTTSVPHTNVVTDSDYLPISAALSVSISPELALPAHTMCSPSDSVRNINCPSSYLPHAAASNLISDVGSTT